MKKLINTFYISTALTAALLLLSYAIAFSFYTDDLTAFTDDFGALDCFTYCGYASLLTALFCFRTDFKSTREKRMFALFCFFAVAALLREAGIQHWLAGTDTTAFKIRFGLLPVIDGIGVRLCHVRISDSGVQGILPEKGGIMDDHHFAVRRRVMQNFRPPAVQFGQTRIFDRPFGDLVRRLPNHGRNAGNVPARFGNPCFNSVS